MAVQCGVIGCREGSTTTVKRHGTGPMHAGLLFTFRLCNRHSSPHLTMAPTATRWRALALIARG